MRGAALPPEPVPAAVVIRKAGVGGLQRGWHFCRIHRDQTQVHSSSAGWWKQCTPGLQLYRIRMLIRCAGYDPGLELLFPDAAWRPWRETILMVLCCAP